VAKAVTVGSLTIPAMIRLGYPRHFAGAVEAAASTGGQITPPVMGAAAFLMVEFLNVPYQTILIAAIAPAFMHFFGVFMQVHFEAKRTGLRGLRPDELPDLRRSLADRWPTLISLALLVGVLVGGFTPYLAAFSGISSCVVVGLTTGGGQRRLKNYAALAVLHGALGFVIVGASGLAALPLFIALVVGTPFALKWLGIRGKIGVSDLIEAFETGAKYALAVGAAAGTVGIVIGVVTLTGVGFKLSYVITSAAQSIAATLAMVLPASWVDLKSLALLAALFMTAIVCILLGAGVPTTATYIIMVTVAAPTLAQMGVVPLVAHFFVFYYGVLADITPPVAMAAYAAAGMAGSDPFKTGNTAFRLGLGKALVPFVFVFSPALLIVVPGFTLYEFIVTFAGCALGIALLSAALSKFLLVEMRTWERLLAVGAALLMIVPGLTSSLIGCAMVVPILFRHIMALRRRT
jgi:TRAP transporter 4TM/12TM fusion protein